MHNIKSSEELVNLIEEKVVRGEMEAGLGPWVVGNLGSISSEEEYPE